ncbi:hypothetical protein D3C73_1013830 [compost metagenome]
MLGRGNRRLACILQQNLVVRIHNEHLAPVHPVDVAEHRHDLLGIERNDQRPRRLRASLLRQGPDIGRCIGNLPLILNRQHDIPPRPVPVNQLLPVLIGECLRLQLHLVK